MSTITARLALVSCGFAIAGVGCTTAQVLRGADLQQLPTVVHAGDRVRVTTTAGVIEEIEVSTLEDGGALRGETTEGIPVEIRAGELAALEYSTPARARTTWLIIGAVLGAGVVAAHDSCKPDGAFGMPACAD